MPDSSPRPPIRGILVQANIASGDPTFVFRVHHPDRPGGPRHTDYAIHVFDIPVEITSGYYELIEGVDGGRGRLDYRVSRGQAPGQI